MTGMRPAGDVLRDMRHLPFADLDAIAPGTSLVLAPHPDDETLGCGGLIIEACTRGRPPLIVAVTDGSASHKSFPPERLQAMRAEELRAAAEILGVGRERVCFLGLADAQAPDQGPVFAAAVAAVARCIRTHAISTLLASWEHDQHCDHQATARIAAAAARMTGVRLLFYPVWGWLLRADHPLPDLPVRGARLDVAAVLARKRTALAAHASQYSALLADDPDGFRLPADLLEATLREDEVFLEA